MIVVRQAGAGAAVPSKAVAAVTADPPAPVATTAFPLNLSTEESGYESDLTRKTSSKGSDTSLSNSPVANRAVGAAI